MDFPTKLMQEWEVTKTSVRVGKAIPAKMQGKVPTGGTSQHSLSSVRMLCLEVGLSCIQTKDTLNSSRCTKMQGTELILNMLLNTLHKPSNTRT